MDTYEKKYNEALERAKKIHDEILNNELLGFPDQIREIFPELRGSEDERIRKWLVDYFSSIKEIVWIHRNTITCEQILAWLEKQKEQKELPLMEADLYFDEWNQQKQNPTKRQCFEEGIRYAQRLQKEQKPTSSEDMPYVADEHFFEREPADSFKYRLAEYMTKNCKKGEGPYGYSYNISSESILEMAKEELIKRGELKEQKPVEWSKEDKKILDDVSHILIGLNYKQIAKDYKQAVEKLIYARPSWKPSEVHLSALLAVFNDPDNIGSQTCQLALTDLYEHLKNL